MSESAQPIAFHHNATPDPDALRRDQIILCTLNAKYIHASLGLRYLQANMGDLESCSTLCEFTINQRSMDIAEQLVAKNPQIIGFGVYIWNIRQTTDLIALIRVIAPDITIVIGGPEVSYEYDQTQVFDYCDYLITGQADFAFKELCIKLLQCKDNQTAIPKVMNAAQPSVNQLASPYHLYSADDLNHRIIYVEASRGCPFKCEFCLSALDKTAWPFKLSEFLADMELLYNRGARQFKFVDRTFNLKVKSCIAILNFFLERMSNDLFLHFEVIPDKLPDDLKVVLQQFPATTLQFEVGIQSFNPAVQNTISRRQDDASTVDNLQWLRQNTNAYIHADLIFGLPGESLQSFAQGFNRLVELAPHEIQVGILKRLRGTKISRHTEAYQMRYATDAPYQLLSNRDIDFPTLQRLQRFARYWDLIANSSRFTHTLPLILGSNAFDRFWQLSNWIFDSSGQTHRISLLRLFELIYEGAIALELSDRSTLTETLHSDYLATGERRAPRWLSAPVTAGISAKQATGHSARQNRHTETHNTTKITAN